MWLPTPTDRAVAEFQTWLLSAYGIECDSLEARRAATSLMHIFTYFAYEHRHLRPEVNGE